MANCKVRPSTKKLVRTSLDEESVGRAFVVPELRNFERGPCRSGFLLSLNCATLKEDRVGRGFVVPELRNFERGPCRSGFCCP